MCGIVAGVTPRQNIIEYLLNGLQTLEYRGYDSAGIAVLGQGTLNSVRSVGRISALREKVATALKAPYAVGIGHTRWATHGAPLERNAHPHISENIGTTVAVVHNGIIENHQELRAELTGQGYVFASDTDTEVIAHALHRELQTAPSLTAAVQNVSKLLRGQYAFATMSKQEPDVVVATRQGAPLLMGRDDRNSAFYLASDISALLDRTRNVAYLNDGDVVTLKAGATTFEWVDSEGQDTDPSFKESALNAASVSRGEYDHYMLKEIMEQPAVARDTLASLTSTPELATVFQDIENIQLLACGTSYHAACVGRHWLESITQIPCAVEVASEFHARKAWVRHKTLVITVSQSGETADTKAALEYALRRGAARSLAICNVPESALARMSDMVLYTKAGPEIGVASTKAFTTQLMALYYLAAAGLKNKSLLPSFVSQLADVGVRMQDNFEVMDTLKAWSKEIAQANSAIFLGRGALHPIALEGALKLKEVSYIHAEGYSAGELKHGPLALLDESLPVIVSVANDELLDKTRANIEEVRARGAKLYVIADEGCDILEDEKTKVLVLPSAFKGAWDLSALLHVVPLQLISYYVGLELDRDIDKPRNLAKSVTVE